MTGKEFVLEKAKEHLKSWIEKNNISDDRKILVEYLLKFPIIYEDIVSEHRWYDIWEYVIQIDDKYISYCFPRNTGDFSVWDMDFGPLDITPESICEVVPYEVTITKYKTKE